MLCKSFDFLPVSLSMKLVKTNKYTSFQLFRLYVCPFAWVKWRQKKKKKKTRRRRQQIAEWFVKNIVSEIFQQILPGDRGTT